MIALLVLSPILYRSAFGTLFFVKGFSAKRIREELDAGVGKDGVGDRFITKPARVWRTGCQAGGFHWHVGGCRPAVGIAWNGDGYAGDVRKSLSASAQETATQVSGGVRFALVTTQAGLMVAIPAIFIIQWIKRVANARQQEMAREELVVTHREEAAAG